MGRRGPLEMSLSALAYMQGFRTQAPRRQPYQEFRAVVLEPSRRYERLMERRRKRTTGGTVSTNKTIAQHDLVLHGVTITHPDRMVCEAGKITKGDVARYYAAVAPLLLNEIARRP